MELQGKPDADALEARVELAALRQMMFGRDHALRVGRHRLIQLIGRGSHGSVFEAEDTELGRRIAVKVVVRELVDDTTREELLVEARAMAQLNHPNVLTIYEAGVTDERFWIAMELVRGSTLQAWAQEHPSGSSERFERARQLLEQAGRGLAAAHASRLVHRDFKPANVLLSDDGRARVADFGLARVWQEAAHQRARAPRTHSSARDEHTSTTVAGTPRYMSPEQIRGTRVDHRSDQFNFAVTAWELVYGELPHDGDNLDDLLYAMEAGPPAVPRSKAVPRWYGRALRRALRPSADGRFSSMDALVAALDPVTRMRRTAIATGATVFGFAASATVAWTRSPVVEEADCGEDRARRELDVAWGPSQQKRLAAALGHRRIIPSLSEGLGRYAHAWTAQYVATCEARWRSESISDRELDARMACLRRMADTMEATVGRLESASPKVIARALGMVKALPDPEGCEDSEEPLPGDPKLIERLGRALGFAEADRIAGRYFEAAAGAVRVAEEALALDAQLLAADAFETAGRAWSEQDDPRRFETLERAHGLAIAAGDDRRATRLAAALALQHTYAWHIEDGNRWLRHARAGLSRRPDRQLELAIRHAEGLWHLKQHEVEQALAIWEPLAEELSDVRSSDNETAWLLRADLVLVYGATARREQAVALAEAQLAETRADLGDTHPRIARLSSALTILEAKRGHDHAAATHAERALAVSRAAYGPVSRRTAIALYQLARVQHRQRDHDHARSSYLGAIAACGETRDEWMARAHRDLGRLDADLGRYEEADQALRQAVSIARDVWAPDGRELLHLRRLRAEVWMKLGRREQATAELEQIAEVDPAR